MTLQERFWTKVLPGNPEECWLWQARVDKDDYGQIRVGNTHKPAHRVSYCLANGLDVEKLSKEIFICHSCDTPRCVNPAHLFIGSVTDNNRDCLSKDRYPIRRKEDHPLAKLTLQEVQKIKDLWHSGRVTQAELASQFSVGQSHISRIVNNKNWTNA